jgi:outer membrane protein TolC
MHRQAATLLFCVVLPLLGGSIVQAAAPGAGDGAPRRTVADCVILALRNDVDLKSAYLDRILQRFDLRKAEKEYLLPGDQPSLKLSTTRTSSWGESSRTESLQNNGGFSASLQVPTGGVFTFAWDNLGNRPDTGQPFQYQSAWAVTFVQPLLKGGGEENASYSLKLARIAEAENILTLQERITTTIKAAIAAYRRYAIARRSLEISEKSLEKSRQTLEINRDLIAAGRLAANEIIQSESDLAQQELSVLRARNDLDAAWLSLAKTLNIDKGQRFDPVEEDPRPVAPPGIEEAVAMALDHRTDYARTRQGLDRIRSTLAKARRNRLWDLSLVTGTTNADTALSASYGSALDRATLVDRRDWTVGLSLSIPLTELTADARAFLAAKNDLEKATWAADKQKRDIEITVTNAIRDLEVKFRSTELARQARALAERKLDVESEKFRAGRTSNFQLLTYQNDLRSAEISEYSALSTYLDALDTLDDTLGTMLETWRISVGSEDDKVPLPGQP